MRRQHNSHTHCQVAQFNTQTKIWQRVWLSLTSDKNDRQNIRRKDTEPITGIWQMWRLSTSYDSFY